MVFTLAFGGDLGLVTDFNVNWDGVVGILGYSIYTRSGADDSFGDTEF